MPKIVTQCIRIVDNNIFTRGMFKIRVSEADTLQLKKSFENSSKLQDAPRAPSSPVSMPRVRDYNANNYRDMTFSGVKAA